MAAATTDRRKMAAAVCAALLVAYATVAWVSVLTKSATYDEPYHAVSAWTQLHLHDYRLDNEDPPLWQYWAALPNGIHTLHPMLTAPPGAPRDAAACDWTQMPSDLNRQWSFVVWTLYRSPGVDAVAFVNRSRAMMFVWAIGLGIAIACWSGKLGGPIAAIVATTAFCLDPNFLAHGPLMKNDVAMSLAYLGVAWAVWHVGRKVTWPRVAALGILCGVALSVKFSGLIAAMVIPVMLLWRAVMSSEPWPVFKRGVTSRGGRLGVAAGLTAFVAAAGIASIWTVYGFRFRPTPDRDIRLNLDQLVQRAASNETAAAYGGNPPATAMENAKPGLLPKLVVFADRHTLMPEGWLAGFLFTYEESLIRPTYLLGERSRTGWWWYFPAAMLFKTPTATLLAVATAAGLLVSRVGRAGLAGPGRAWGVASLVGPVVVFMAVAMRSNLNIGIRHVLPVYPLLFVGTGWAASAAWNRWRKPVRVLAWSAGVLLAVESLTAIPDFIPFFNVPSHLIGRPIELLGDSNLDWGQDLPALVEWQEAHKDKKLILSYFGEADPRYYGLQYMTMPGGYHFDEAPKRPPPVPGLTVAISATNLQGIWMANEAPGVPEIYAGWLKRQPTTVLNGSIYIFELTPEQIQSGAY
jgi:hypothetical protein